MIFRDSNGETWMLHWSTNILWVSRERTSLWNVEILISSFKPIHLRWYHWWRPSNRPFKIICDGDFKSRWAKSSLRLFELEHCVRLQLWRSCISHHKIWTILYQQTEIPFKSTSAYEERVWNPLNLRSSIQTSAFLNHNLVGSKKVIQT